MDQQDTDAPACAAPVGPLGCLAIAAELYPTTWPGKFKPDLPPCYNEILDPAEFLQLYTLSIRVAGGGDKVMACWFPMALKGGTISWLLNLPKAYLVG